MATVFAHACVAFSVRACVHPMFVCIVLRVRIGGKGGKKGDKKNRKNADKDADIKAMSIVNSNLWQARLEVLEQSRTEHRCLCFYVFTFDIKLNVLHFWYLCYLVPLTLPRL